MDQRMRCGGNADLGDCSVLISMVVMLLAVGLLPLTRVVVCRPKTEAPSFGEAPGWHLGGRDVVCWAAQIPLFRGWGATSSEKDSM